MCCSVAEDYNRSAAFTILNGISTKSAPLERSFSLKGDDNTNKGCFGRKKLLFRESGDFARNREA